MATGATGLMTAIKNPTLAGDNGVKLPVAYRPLFNRQAGVGS